jgi:hypothetical protein
MGSSKCCCPAVKMWQSRMFHSGAKDWSSLLWRCKFVFTLVTSSNLQCYIVYCVVFESGQYFYQATHWTLLILLGIKLWVMLQQPRILYTSVSWQTEEKAWTCVCAHARVHVLQCLESNFKTASFCASLSYTVLNLEGSWTKSLKL